MAGRTPEVFVPQLEELIGYTFNNRTYAWEALNCKGALFWQHSEGNKRLALLGDTILKMQILKNWYTTTKLPTEVGNNEVVQLASNNNLSTLGRKIDLNRLIVPNNSQGNKVSAGQVADAMEAIIGAVYVDGGEAALPGVMQRLGLA